MLGGWTEFAGGWIDGCLDFGEFWQWLSNLYFAITKNSDIEAIWSAIMTFLSPISVLVPFITLAGCLSLAFFGQKLMPVLKFIALFIVGFVLGVYFLPPSLNGVLSVPDWLCGILLALVVSVLYRFLYIGLIAFGVGYCAYTVLYSGFYFREIAEISVPLLVIATIIALFAVVIAFYYLKYIEIAITSVVGAYLFTFYFRTMLFDYKSLPAFASAPWIAAFILTVLIATPAFIVQFRTRKRY